MIKFWEQTLWKRWWHSKRSMLRLHRVAILEAYVPRFKDKANGNAQYICTDLKIQVSKGRRVIQAKIACSKAELHFRDVPSAAQLFYFHVVDILTPTPYMNNPFIWKDKGIEALRFSCINCHVAIKTKFLSSDLIYWSSCEELQKGYKMTNTQ